MTPAPDDRLITIARAAALAAERGTPVSEDTILAAARRGAIDRAEKHGKLWKFPAWAFDDWLAVHIRRNPYGKGTGKGRSKGNQA